MSEAPIRLGIAGLGRAFTLMLPTFTRDPRIRIAGGFDPRSEARQQFSRDFQAPAYAAMEELAADPGVEVIYVAGPHQYHAELACRAAAHGKHVLVEKPMALSLAECDAMIEACRRAGVRLLIGHCHSYDTPYLETRAIIDAGEVGEVKMIHAFNYTDFLYRPRRPEELDTAAGGGVVFNQAAHQIDVVRLLAGQRATRVRAVLGAWDPRRPTEGAYAALIWFEQGIFASLIYGGYAHFDSDEWCGGIGEMGRPRADGDYGAARRRLAALHSRDEEAAFKAARNYGGPDYRAPAAEAAPWHQHFGHVIVSCERADLRPLPDAVLVYGDETTERRIPARPAVPRFEVIDELYAAIRADRDTLHDGAWGRTTLELCLALLTSAREQRDVELAPPRE